MKNRRLNDRVRTFIVRSLVCFETPAAVLEAVKREFGEQITPQAIQHYDPNRSQGALLARKWRQLFEETRKAFLEDCGTIGISHRAVRLKKLDRQVALYEEAGNGAMVAQLLKQAAEEMGKVYTNRRELTGRGGRPVEVQDVSNRELAKAVAEILADGMDALRQD